ncbi:MAG TPA: hypothetical protein VIS74_00560 [Chthoniobacterales bacterium]
MILASLLLILRFLAGPARRLIARRCPAAMAWLNPAGRVSGTKERP